MSDILKIMVKAFDDCPYATTSVSSGDDGDDIEVSLGEWAIEKGMADAIAAANAAGYVLVPKEATPDMAAAGADREDDFSYGPPSNERAAAAYKAMILAAPVPSKEQPE